jgi:RND family efflux transporter, MFP subunit
MKKNVPANLSANFAAHHRAAAALALLAALALPMPAAAQNDAAAEKTYIVRSKKPQRATISDIIVQTGSLEAPETVTMLPKISGRLVSTILPDGESADVGSKVKKGDIIAKIESNDYAARFAAAEAALESAAAARKDAQLDYDRTQALLKDDTATQQEADKTAAALARAAAAVKSAEADLALARINLDETEIRAPFDGVISAIHAYPGAMLSPTTPICVILKTDYLKLFFNLPTTAFSKLVAGATDVEVEIDAYPGETAAHKIHSVHPSANGATRTVRAELRLDNAEGRLLPGMYAKGTVELNKRENLLAVDWESAIKIINQTIVYKVVDGKAIAQNVKLGTRQNDIVEIIEGVGDDDEIVYVGQHRLTGGASVRQAAAIE